MADHEREMEELAGTVAAWKRIPPGDRRTTTLEGAGEGWIAENFRILAGIAEFGAPDDSLSGTRWGPLEIAAPLAADDLGEVWSARTDDGEDVRLRLFRPIQGDPSRARSDVVLEGKALVALRHPGIVRVHGVAAHGGRLGMWGDAEGGEDLAADLDEGAWPVPRVAGTLSALSLALEACRAAGLTGRDLSPDRLALRDGKPVLREPLGRGPRPEGDDAVPGGWLAAPPEVWRGGADSPRGDVWSLAALAVRLLTGCWPVDGARAADVAARHRDGREVAVSSGVDGTVRSVLARALRPDPKRRPPGPPELAAAFAEAARRPPSGRWSVLRRLLPGDRGA